MPRKAMVAAMAVVVGFSGAAALYVFALATIPNQVIVTQISN